MKMAILAFISLFFLVNSPLECLSESLMNDSMSVTSEDSSEVDFSGFGSGGEDPSSKCVDAQLDVAAKPPCFKAVMSIAEKLPNYGDRLPLDDDLREYCSPSCRKLNLLLTDACNTNNDTNDDVPNMVSAAASLDLVCTVRGRKSCYQYFIQTSNALVQCVTVTLSKCSSLCARALRKIVNRAGCCVRRLFEFNRRLELLQLTVDQLFSVCRINESQQQSPCRVINEQTDCPYEGQIRQECAPHPSCLASCDILNGVSPAHPCIQRCSVNGCVCPNGTVINEANKKCVIPNECGACPVKGQIRKDIVRDPYCSSTCDTVDELLQGPCYAQDVRYGCECPDGKVIDENKKECISPKDCVCRIKGQIREDCAPDPSCFRTCDSINGIISDRPCLERCMINGCVCPNGTVLNKERTECVTPDQCKGTPCNITEITANISRRRRIVKIKFSANEPTAKFRCKLDNGAMRRCKSPWKQNVRNLERGEHHLTIIGRCAGSDGESKMKIFRFSVR